MSRSDNPRVDELLEAADRGDSNRVVELLDSGVDVDSGDFINNTALMYAVFGGHLDLIRKLLDRGADLNVENTKHYTALTHGVILSGGWPGWNIPRLDSRPLEILLEAGARYRLYEATLINDVELARLRLDEGSDPDTGEWSYDGSLLQIAAGLGHLAIVDLLLDRGANIEAKDDLGQRPLLVAARHGQFEIVRRLADRGAAINAVDWFGRSALSYSRRRGDQGAVDLLLSRGAVWSVADALELEDIPLFTTRLDEEIRACLEQADPVEEGLDEDDPATKYLRTPVVDQLKDDDTRLAMLAASGGNAAILGVLLDRGAVHLLDYEDKHTLLAEVARHGHLEAIRLLIDRGADLHQIGEDGLTPLAWAIKEDQVGAAELLRRAGSIH